MSDERFDLLETMGRLVGNTRTMAGLSGDPRMRDALRQGEKARDAVAALIEALEMATRQNSHDMLMTGDELRTCNAALARVRSS